MRGRGEPPGTRILGRRYLNQPKHFSEVHTKPRYSRQEGGPLERLPEKKGDEQMRTYYVKVFRHQLSTTVLTGFIAGAN